MPAQKCQAKTEQIEVHPGLGEAGRKGKGKKETVHKALRRKLNICRLF